MPNIKTKAAAKAVSRISLDTWAVMIALLAAALIRFGVIPHVHW